MAPDAALPLASLAALEPYPVPEGSSLQFQYTRHTTDGFMRGDVSVHFQNGRSTQVIAYNVPVTGNSKAVQAVGDYAKIFPDPIAVAPPTDEE